MYALDSKRLPNTQYFFTFREAFEQAKRLGLAKRNYKIRPVH